ncbi:hypothetical protein NC652_015342 [Populus alba x Populus x berolinensis]|nr:hypothetical protein NC652_015342 [Populus alba x Populus x berolinensis]
MEADEHYFDSPYVASGFTTTTSSTAVSSLCAGHDYVCSSYVGLISIFPGPIALLHGATIDSMNTLHIERMKKEKIQQAQSLMVSYCRTSCFVVVMVVLTISILVLPLVLPPLPPPPLVLLFVPLMILSLLVLLALRSSQMPNMDTTAAV